MTLLHAGWASADITPQVGIHMGGYWGRRSGAVAIHDDLTARVVVWRGTGAAGAPAGAALVALDLVGLAADAVARVRREVARAVAAHAPVDEAAVMVCCSHTHAGPLTVPFRGMGRLDAGYLERVCEQSAACAALAAAALAPVACAYERAPVQIGINRRQGPAGHVAIGRNADGPVAPYAHVVTLTAGARRAILFQHACHPVVLGGANHEISAEFPGAARREIAAQTGAFAVYVNGAAGDINPRVTGGGFADVEALGAELGRAVAAASGRAQPLQEARVAWHRERLDLPLLEPPPSALAAARVAVEELKAALRGAGADEWERRVPEARLAWSRDLLDLARSGGGARTQPFEIQGLRVGGVELLGMEGEIFVRYQLDLEAPAGPRPLVLCGYANGCIGYVPTADEYARGGYEVEVAYKVYPSVLMIAPESEALIRDGARRTQMALGGADR